MVGNGISEPSTVGKNPPNRVDPDPTSPGPSDGRQYGCCTAVGGLQNSSKFAGGAICFSKKKHAPVVVV